MQSKCHEKYFNPSKVYRLATERCVYLGLEAFLRLGYMWESCGHLG